MKRVSKIVSSDLALGRLGKQLTDHRVLLQRLKALLPEPLSGQLKAAVLQQGCLSLFVPSPVWASRFRYLVPGLRQQMRQHGMHVERVVTRILPQDATKPGGGQKRHRHQPRLSREAGMQLRECAQAIGDPSLRDALLRISMHGGKVR
jgi:hypothetical protein